MNNMLINVNLWSYFLCLLFTVKQGQWCGWFKFKPLTCTHERSSPTWASAGKNDGPDELTATKLHPIGWVNHRLNPSCKETPSQQHSLPHNTQRKQKWVEEQMICPYEQQAFCPYSVCARITSLCEPNPVYIAFEGLRQRLRKNRFKRAI